MSEIADRIFHVRQENNLTRKAFAEALGVGESKVQALETSRQRADHEVLVKIANCFNIDANWLLFGETRSQPVDNDDPAFVKVPRYTVSASAGNSGSFVSDFLEVTHYAFSRDWINRRQLDPKQLQIINVRGDSMEPTLFDGDLILLDRSQKKPSDGSTFVVRIWDEHVVKHVQRTGENTISLISANKVYPPREIELVDGDDKDFEIIGRVVASMHEW